MIRFKKPSLKLVTIFGFVVLFAGSFVFLRVSAEETSREIAKTNTPADNAVQQLTLEQDPKLLEIAKQVGINDTSKLKMKFAEEPARSVETAGYYQSAVHSYRDSKDITHSGSYGSIQIKPTDDHEGLKRTLAHEYLHYVWYEVMDQNQRDMNSGRLASIFKDDPAMQEQLVSYAEEGSLNSTELFSFYCTESSDKFLTKHIVDECNKYISRDALTMIR